MLNKRIYFFIKLIKKTQGFTLVELMISTMLISIIVVASVIVIREGREIDIEDNYRKTARYLIQNKLNSDAFSCSNYGSVTSQVYDNLALAPGIKCTLNLTVSNQTFFIATGPDVPPIPNKKIEAKAKWNGPNGKDSLIVHKWITEY